MAEMYPDDLLYNAAHDWARIDGDEAVLGITWFATDQLGQVVEFLPPEAGTAIEKDASYGEVESHKMVSELIAPLSGELLEVNPAVVEDPEKINADPYGEGWLIRIRLADPSEVDDLLDAAAYRDVLGE